MKYNKLSLIFVSLFLLVLCSIPVNALYSNSSQTVEGTASTVYGRGVKIVPTANIIVYNVSVLFSTTPNQTTWTRVRIFNTTTNAIGTGNRSLSDAFASFSTPVILTNGSTYYIMVDNWNGSACTVMTDTYRNTPALTNSQKGDAQWTGRYYFLSNCNTLSFEGSAGTGDVQAFGYELNNVTVYTNTIGFTSPTTNSSTYQSKTWIAVNTTASLTDFSNITTYLYKDGSLLYTNVSTNTTAYYNFSGLTNGNYSFNASSFNSTAKANTTETRSNIIIDTTVPTISYNSNTDTNNSYKVGTSIFINVTGADTYFSNISLYLYNGTSNALISSVNTTNTTAYNNWTAVNGYYKFNATVRDLAGNTVNLATRNITLDTVNPTISYNANSDANNSYKSGTTVFINVTSADINYKNTTLYLYNGTSNVLISAINTTNATAYNNWTAVNGYYKFNATARDYAGNVVNLATRNITLDTVNPVINFNAPTLANNTNWGSAVIPINVTVTDVNYNSTTITLYNASESITQTYNTTNTTQYLNFTVTANATWYFDVTARDLAGNILTSGRYNITVDTNVPVVTFVSPTDATGSYVNRNYALVNTSVAGNNIKNITVRLYNSALTLINTTTNSTTTTYLFNNYTSLNNSIYYYNATACNLAGYCTNTTLQNVTVDTTNPSLSYNANSDLSGYKNVNYIFMNVTASDTNYKNTTLYLYKSGVLNDTYVSTLSISGHNFTSLADGNYSVNATARDLAGNEVNLVTRNITIDTVTPTISYLAPTDLNGTYVNRLYFLVNVSVADTSYSNMTVSAYCTNVYIDTSNFTTSNTFFRNYSVPSSDSCFYTITARDLAGNVNTTTPQKVTLDVIAPNISYNANSDVAGYKTVNYIFMNITVNDTNYKNTTLYLYKAGVLNQTINSTNLTSSVNFTSLLDASYSVNATSCDLANNCANLATRNITTDASIPVVSFVAPTMANDTHIAQDYIPINSSVADSNFANQTIYIYNINGTLVDSSFSTNAVYFYNKTSLANGEYLFNVTAYDLANNRGYSETRNITLDTTIPIINLVAPTPLNNTVAGNISLPINITVSTPNIKNITVRLSNSTTLLYTNTSSVVNVTPAYFINYTLPLTGSYSYNITSCDEANNCNTTGNYYYYYANNFINITGKNLYGNSAIQNFSVFLEPSGIGLSQYNYNASTTNGSIYTNEAVGICGYTNGIITPCSYRVTFNSTNYLVPSSLTGIDITANPITSIQFNTSQARVRFQAKEFGTNNSISANFSILPPNYVQGCYQEFANVSETCGALDNGNYSYTNALNDGDWATDLGGSFTESYYKNVTLPLFATSIIWEVKDGGGIFNLTVPANCLAQNPIQRRTRLDEALDDTFWECYNGSDWTSLRTYTTSNNAYEEADYFYYSNSNSNGSIFYLNADNYSAYTSSTGYYNKTDSITVTALEDDTQTINNVYNATTTFLISPTLYNNNYTLTLTARNYTYTTTTNITSNPSFNLTSGAFYVSLAHLGVTNITYNVDIPNGSSIFNLTSFGMNHVNFIDIRNTSNILVNNNVTIKYPNGNIIYLTTDANGNVSFSTANNLTLQNGTYNITFLDYQGYITPITFLYNSTTLPFNRSYNISRANLSIKIYDAETGVLLTSNVSLSITGLGGFNTSNGSIFIENQTISSQNYVAFATSTGYYPAQISFTYTNQEVLNLTIQMINLSSPNFGNYVVNVFDNYYNNLAGATIQLQKFNFNTNSWEEISRCFSDSNGQCIFGILINTFSYRAFATLDIDGVTYSAYNSVGGGLATANPTTVSIYLKQVSTPVVDELTGLTVTPYNTTLVNNVSYLNADFNDATGNSHTICIEYSYDVGFVNTVYPNGVTCLTSASGNINYGQPYALNTTYNNRARIYVVLSDGTQRNMYVYPYSGELSFENTFRDYIAILMLFTLIVLLAISLHSRNMMFFFIGVIGWCIIYSVLTPSWVSTGLNAVMVFMAVIGIFISRKKEAVYSV